MTQRNRIALAVLIGLLNFAIITAYHLSNPTAVNDLGFPLCAGRVLLAGGDPYGGALFADRRYGNVFMYHNSAPSYYGARAFRGSPRV